MASEKHTEHVEQRSGKDRRKDACALCSHYRKAEEKREVANKEAHETMWKSIGNKVPRWVLLSIGIPIVGAIFCFSGWTALNGISMDKRIVKLEVQSDYIATNLTKLMQASDVQPVLVIEKKP